VNACFTKVDRSVVADVPWPLLQPVNARSANVHATARPRCPTETSPPDRSRANSPIRRRNTHDKVFGRPKQRCPNALTRARLFVRFEDLGRIFRKTEGLNS